MFFKYNIQPLFFINCLHFDYYLKNSINFVHYKLTF